MAGWFRPVHGSWPPSGDWVAAATLEGLDLIRPAPRERPESRHTDEPDQGCGRALHSGEIVDGAPREGSDAGSAWIPRCRRLLAAFMLDSASAAAPEHQLEIWCSNTPSLLCSVNDAVNVLPCSTCVYLNGGPSLTCAAFTGRREVSGRPQTTDLAVGGSNPSWRVQRLVRLLSPWPRALRLLCPCGRFPR